MAPSLPQNPRPLSAPPPSGELPPCPALRGVIPRGPTPAPQSSCSLVPFALDPSPGWVLSAFQGVSGGLCICSSLPPVAEHCLPDPEGTEVPVCVPPPDCELLRRACLCLPASSRAQWLSELLYIECHGRHWRFIFRIAVLKLVCKTL